MGYRHEREFVASEMQRLYSKYEQIGVGQILEKTQFDLVTNVDEGIEGELALAIRTEFPGDRIHGEEDADRASISGRTWTIDPIDGTCNMANRIPLYGVQCSLFEDDDVVLGVIYIPHFGDLMYAELGQGCYLNGEKVSAKKDGELNHALISFGDYPHSKSPEVAARQHRAIAQLYPKVAKIRMFGAACLDFLMVASGSTDATVVITRNLWDIAPGIMMTREAGAILTNLEGEPYSFGDSGVVASATEELARLIAESFA